MSTDEFRQALKTEKIVVGANQTLRNLRVGKVKKIFLASNCPPELKNDLLAYCNITKVPLVDLPQPSDEVALLCKKKFQVTVVSY